VTAFLAVLKDVALTFHFSPDIFGCSQSGQGHRHCRGNKQLPGPTGAFQDLISPEGSNSVQIGQLDGAVVFRQQ
jgi:hypothetical protein